MFGSSGSPPKQVDTSVDNQLTTPVEGVKGPLSPQGDAQNDATDKAAGSALSTTDEPSSPGAERKRRSSGIAKARDMFSSAKHSLVAGTSPTRNTAAQTPIQKLGKVDPALNVPQGSLNNAAGESSPTPRSTFRVGVTEDKNKKCRRTMEDTHAYLYNFLSTPAPSLSSDSNSRDSETSNPLQPMSSQPVIETDNGYFAIFDGHAGTFAAEWCGKKLHIILEETIKKNPNRAIPELLDETFTNVDSQLEKLPLKNSGCTAVTAVLRWEDRIPNSISATGSTSIAPAAAAIANSEGAEVAAAEPHEAKLKQLSSSATRSRVLYTANVGDARIVLSRNGKALRLSYDHKGSDDNEGKRIANAGGLILNNRVNGVLAVTRALGDSYMKDLVTGHPYTTETVIQPDIDEFLILACDGLWDVCSDQEAVDLIRNIQDPQAASKVLVDHALSRFSTDNLSCMVVRFDRAALQDTAESRSEPIGVQGDPATLRGGISESEAILNAAKKGMPVESADSNELDRISTDMIREEEEAEPGPELDPDGLIKAKEKAALGQQDADASNKV